MDELAAAAEKKARAAKAAKAAKAWATVVGIARRQHGLVTRSQVVRSECSLGGLYGRLERGELEVVHPGVYRFASSRPTWEQRALAALLWLGSTAALARSSAAHVHRLDGFSSPPLPIEVLVPRRRINAARSVPGTVVIHRARKGFATCEVGGLRVTELTRTLLDLSATLKGDALDDVLDSAQRMYPGTDGELERRLARKTRGLKGAVQMKELLADRNGLATDSPLEARVFRALRRVGIKRPSHQIPVCDEQGYVTRLDFAWREERVALHVDGYLWHHQRTRFEHDREVANRLGTAQWRSISVTSRALDGGTWLTALKAALAERAPQLALL